VNPFRSSSPAWQVERRGIEPVPGDERHGRVGDVFRLWLAGNLAITSVVIGAVVMSYGLSLKQSLIALLGVWSFLLVGYFSVPGVRTGRPTMALSAECFGRVGNVFPAALSWLNLVGWQTVVLVVATYALEAVFQIVFGTQSGPLALLTALAVVAALAFGVAFLGHAAIVKVQTAFAYLFGGLTLVAAAFLLPDVHWGALLRTPDGPWLTGLVPAFSIVVAFSGLSWVNMASDYSRYLPLRTPARPVVLAATLGSVVPVLALMGLGVVLAPSLPGLASAANPIAELQALLPSWFAVPYLLAVVGGMVTGDILDIYSSGLSLIAARVRIPRSRTVLVDAALSLAASVYILLVASDAIATFQAFLTLIAGALAPWAAIFLVDAWGWSRRGYPGREALLLGGSGPAGSATVLPAVRWPAFVAWAAGIVTSLLLTSTSVYTGALAKGVFAGSSLGFLAGFAVALALYGGFQALAGRGVTTARGVEGSG